MQEGFQEGLPGVVAFFIVCKDGYKLGPKERQPFFPCSFACDFLDVVTVPEAEHWLETIAFFNGYPINEGFVEVLANVARLDARDVNERQTLGAALTSRHQGLGKRDHQVMMNQRLT